MSFFSLLWFVALQRVRALSTCFDSPELKDLVDARGNSYPIGIWVNDWAAGHLTATVAGIVIKEKLGYNVELKGPGALALDGFFALTGCTSPGDKTDRGCGDRDDHRLTNVHINVEVWTSTYQLAWEELQLKYPDKAPKNLGNMSYYGATALYVPSGVQERAYDAEGINLDFYRDYNSSRENPGRHFANPGDINVSYLAPCTETALMLNEVMSNYLDLTGDLEGVNGTAPDLTGTCYNTYFWLAPGCRTQPSTCLIWFTGGNGWGMFETLLKAAAYNMPVATAVASSFTNYGLLPNSYDAPDMMLYWWVPDPTFLRLTPMKITFPEHDPDAWAKGDSRTAARDVSIDKHVSQDLESLAPEVVELISRLTMSLNTVNNLMRNQLDTGDSNFDVACRWLKGNEASWSSWLPERGKCFSQFGMYSERTQTFLMQRDDSDSAITCRACPSGFYSSRLEDDQGITFICLPCGSGSFQPSGAATSCNPCPAGSYQNETASLSCNRCPVGEYQDVEGGSLCKVCPTGTSTRLLGSVSISDCGCEARSINIAKSGTFDCVPCMSGLDCPFSSTLENLKSGRSSDGPDSVPRIRTGYYTTPEEPLEVLHCRPESSCPGGTPGRCNNNLVGTLCAVCPEGEAQTLATSGCEECGATVVGWLIVIPVVMGFLVVAYYFTNLEVLTQATPFKAGVMASAIAVSALQALALVGLMSVKWPTTFQRVSSNLQIVLLDFDGMGLSCLSGSDPLVRYLTVVFVFPAGLIWLFMFWSFTLALTNCVKWRCFKPWKLHFTFNTAGLGMQLGYGTMAAVAMKPLMCYSHPDGRQSLITYPNLFCGEREHSFLQVAGISFLAIFVVGFFVICSYAAYNMPQWCTAGQKERVQSFRFFMGNFRFDCYWFILLVLLRGFSFALAIVIGTNVPPAQTTLASLILTTYAILQSWMRPWKVPVINATDMIVNAGLLLLVNKAIQIDTDMETQFAETFCVGLLLMILVSLVLAFILSGLALVLQKCGAEWRQLLTFGHVGKEKEICKALKVCADDLIKIEEEELARKINLTNSYDVQTLLKFIDLVSELFDNTMLEGVKFSRVNPTVMNRRSIASAASDLMMFNAAYRRSVISNAANCRGSVSSTASEAYRGRGSLSSTASDLDPADPEANRGSIVSNVSEPAGAAANELPAETHEAEAPAQPVAEAPEVRSKIITAL